MRNVLVSGATRGLGLAIARGLAEQGYHVCGASRKRSEGFDALAEAFPGQVLHIAADLSDMVGLRDVVVEAKSVGGPIYGLVNNAGLGTDGLLSNMQSIIATTGYSGLSVYGATKSAMIGFTKSLAREVGRLGVTVNAIAPGFVDTDLTEGLGAEGRDQVVRRAALRRLAEPVDVAQMTCFLMGEGGRNITGAVMTVDAGATA